MSSLTPQEKKRLSYERDRRNRYGENAQSSRTAIAQRKQKGRRAARRAAQQIVPAARHQPDLLADDSVENRLPHTRFGKRQVWRKCADIALGTVVQWKKEGRVARYGRKQAKLLPNGTRLGFDAPANTVDHEGILQAKPSR